MATVKWSPDDTINETELARQAKIGAVTQMTIEQTRDGYQVIVRLNWHPHRVALATRRSNTEPRTFRSLERLVSLIEQRYPTIRDVNIELMRLPGRVGSSLR